MPSLIDRYEDLIGDMLHPDPAQRRVVEHLEALRQALSKKPGRLRRLIGANETPMGLYLWGDVGVGKSMLVDLLVSHIDGMGVQRWHFHAFMRALHQALHHARRRTEAEPLMAATDDMIEGLTLLALDEVEITDITDAMIVGRVFERLKDHNVAVVATSNKAPDGLYAGGLKRELFVPFVKLIGDTMDVIELNGGQDYRRSCGASRNVYFTNESDEIDRIWASIRSPEVPYPVHGERISIRRKGKALRSEFNDLCRVAIGSAQYIDIASFADKLFVESIPRMGPQDEDAARRFIMLIDAIYDQRKALVVSAAADPDQLYVGEDFVNEFRRTASRLHKMRAADWRKFDSN